MALNFNEQKGGKQKGNFDTYEMAAENTVRIVGDILPRYVYWIDRPGGKPVPMECLAYNRETERFDNAERDYVKEYFPDLKCGWAYATQVIDIKDGTLKVLNLKKKLWEQVMTAAEDLGDPTNTETGYDLVFKKVKTGPLAYNVEYQLQVLKLKKRALTATEKEVIADLKSMDELMPRPTPASQKEFLEKLKNGTSGNAAPAEVDNEVAAEFDIK